MNKLISKYQVIWNAWTNKLRHMWSELKKNKKRRPSFIVKIWKSFKLIPRVIISDLKLPLFIFIHLIVIKNISNVHSILQQVYFVSINIPYDMFKDSLQSPN